MGNKQAQKTGHSRKRSRKSKSLISRHEKTRNNINSNKESDLESMCVNVITNNEDSLRVSPSSPPLMEYPATPQRNPPESVNTKINIEGDDKLLTPGTSAMFDSIAEGFSLSDDVDNHDLSYENVTPIQIAPICDGLRVVDPNFFFSEIMKAERYHSRVCTDGKLQLQRELKRTGLKSAFLLDCKICNRLWTIESQRPESADINVNAVWSCLSSGIGFTQFSDIFSVMNIPTMSSKVFSSITEKIEQSWEEKMQDYMKTTGAREREIAISKGDVDDDGVPYITVILDGGWSARSYGHSYNAHGCVAVIIGAETGEILHYGILSHNCAKCSSAKRRKKSPKKHKCTKTFSGTSTSMEWNIIVNGFNCSEDVHGVRYKYFIADGDANVFAKIRNTCKYGRTVRKIECANHKVRCFTSSLHRIANNTSLPVEFRKKLKLQIPRMSRGARSAIRYCEENKDSVDDLCHDFKNIPNHVFGDHVKCRPYIKEHCKTDEKNLMPMFDGSKFLKEISSSTQQLVNHAPSLIKNLTSNKAENFMSLNAKTNNGKRCDYTRSSSYSARVLAAGLTFQKGSLWMASPYKAYHGVSPGVILKKNLIRKDRQRIRNAARRLLGNRLKKSSAPADKHYGAVMDLIDEKILDKPDMSPVEFKQKCIEKKLSLQVTREKRDEIQRKTIGQSNNSLWDDVRENRLTASWFGDIVDRNEKTPCKALIHRKLYNVNQFSSTEMKFGNDNEGKVISRLEKILKVKVEPCGIFIDLKYGFLAASPDGLIGNNGIVEVKCVPSVQKFGGLKAAAEFIHEVSLEMKNRKREKNIEREQQYRNLKKNFCLFIDSDNELKLKKKHKFRRQIQGQLNITQRDFCYLVVMCDIEKEVHIEKILRDTTVWENEMVPKLQKFYMDCLLPEIVDARVPRGLAIREPPYAKQLVDAMPLLPRKICSKRKLDLNNSNNKRCKKM